MESDHKTQHVSRPIGGLAPFMMPKSPNHPLLKPNVHVHVHVHVPGTGVDIQAHTHTVWFHESTSGSTCLRMVLISESAHAPLTPGTGHDTAHWVESADSECLHGLRAQPPTALQPRTGSTSFSSWLPKFLGFLKPALSCPLSLSFSPYARVGFFY